MSIVVLAAVSIFGVMYFTKSFCRGEDGGSGGMTGPNGSLCFPGFENFMKEFDQSADAKETDPDPGAVPEGEDDTTPEEDPEAPAPMPEDDKPPSHHNYQKRTTAQQAADPSNKCVGKTGQAYLDCYNKAYKAKFAQAYYTSKIRNSITVA